jgi:guanine deaminase
MTPPLRPSALRGRLLCPGAGGGVVYIADGLIEVDPTGRITAAGPAPADCPLPPTRPGAVWCPGFVDTHIHFPQTRVIGSAAGPLLDWLDRTVFPEEARFVERRYAEAVATEFCAALAAAGTTTAAIYSASDPGATDALFAALAHRGLRARAGLTLMDRGAPPALCVPADAALPAAEALIHRWHGHDDRLYFAITPRFALSCTDALLRGAAALADRHGLFVQTHLSENTAEIRATSLAYPDAADYLAVYADRGLLGPRSLFAHCVWLSPPEWDRLAAADAAVAHCPDSNFFLGSGQMPLAAPLARGIRVGLGTDVGAGRSFSLRRIAASAYDTSLITGACITPEALLWHATAGGALALGFADRVGRIEPGFDADLVAIDLPPYVPDTSAAIFDALLFRHDAGPVAATYVRGRRIHAIDDDG